MRWADLRDTGTILALFFLLPTWAQQEFVDVNPSVNSTLLSDCTPGTYGTPAGTTCTECEGGFTTEVWSEEQPGAMECQYSPDNDDEEEDEDGEDSDDWVPSLAACKSTCVGTCPGIVWTEPAGPTSCIKCSGGMEWTKVPSSPSTTVHKRFSTGATAATQCGFCTNGLTFIRADSTCKKTGVCSTIGPVPYFKVAGNCVACPADEDTGTPLQFAIGLTLLSATGVAIWLSNGRPEPDVNIDSDSQELLVQGAGPLVDSALVLLPTFQFLATAFSCDFTWPSFVRDMGIWMKTVFSGNVFEVLSPECLFSYGQYNDDDRYLAVLGLKFGLFLILALLFGGIALSGNAQGMSAFAAVYSFTLVLIASACFTAIDIVELESGPSAGEYALKILPSVTSETDDFGAMVGYGVVGLLVFLIAIPGFLFMQLKAAQAAGTLWAPETRAKYGALFIRYRSDCWWFEFVVMGRKILLSAVAILSGNAIVTFAFSSIVIVSSMAAHFKFQPYRSSSSGHKIKQISDGEDTKYINSEDDEGSVLNHLDKFELLCLGCVLDAYSLGIICYLIESGSSAEDGTTTFVTILVFLAVIAPVVGAIFLYTQSIEESSAGDEATSTHSNPLDENDKDKDSFDDENDNDKGNFDDE